MMMMKLGTRTRTRGTNVRTNERTIRNLQFQKRKASLVFFTGGSLDFSHMTSDQTRTERICRIYQYLPIITNKVH